MSADDTKPGWDCHAHVFGPYERYPLAADRSYTPPEAVASAYDALLEGLGLGHGVLVHPSAYGVDFSLLLDTLATRPHLRGVIVATAAAPDALDGLRDRGVRAARFSCRSGAGATFAGSASMDDLAALAPRLADAGLHAELWTDGASLPDIAQTLAELPVPIVIDHMGGFDVKAGVDAPGFRALLSLVESGNAYVKMSVYRSLVGAEDLERGLPFHRALLEAAPHRLLWGSDWPHLRIVPEPETRSLLDTFTRWTGDEALVKRILEENPLALYA